MFTSSHSSEDENQVARTAQGRNLATRILGPGLAAVAVMLGSPVAQLTGTMNLSVGDAIAVLGLLTGSGIAVLMAFHPELIAVLGTMRFILAVSGTGAVMGF